MKKMFALLAACLWLAGCTGDGTDNVPPEGGGSENQQTGLNIRFDRSMPIRVAAGETCRVGYTLSGADEYTTIDIVAHNGYRAEVVEKDSRSGEIVIHVPVPAADERIIVILSGAGDEAVSRYIDLEVMSNDGVDVKIKQVDAWARVIHLSGECTENTNQVGFRYRKQGADEWTKVVGTKNGRDFSASIQVEEDTTYEITAYCQDNVSDIQTVTTESAAQLPNGGFDDWNFEDEDSFWACGAVEKIYGRPGSQFAVKICPTIEPFYFSYTNNYNEKLKNGSFFTGKLLKFANGSEAEIYGQPFSSRPMALRGYIQFYRGQSDDKRRNIKEGCIEVALGTWQPDPADEENFSMDISDHPVVDCEWAFHPTNPDIIAYGKLSLTRDIDTWTEFSIPLTYTRTDRKPTHLIIRCQASLGKNLSIYENTQYGHCSQMYTGNENILCLDDFELLYDYNF